MVVPSTALPSLLFTQRAVARFEVALVCAGTCCYVAMDVLVEERLTVVMGVVLA